MKAITLSVTLIILSMIPGICLADTPRQVGGFTLDVDIEDYKDQLLMELAPPLERCPNCNGEIEEGYKFCPNCGHNLEGE